MTPVGETHHEHEPLRRPTVLDLVRVDGRWAQVYASSPDTGTVGFLDDGSQGTLQWNDFDLVADLNTHVALLQGNSELALTTPELDNVQWGSEAKKNKKLKLEIHVFGEYKRKAQSPE